MVNRPWRCEVCGIGFEEAEGRRRKAGLGGLSSRALTCSVACSNVRGQRVRGAALFLARRRAPPLHSGRRGEWACSECGVDLEGARRRRRRDGLLEVILATQLVCTPACRRARVARLLRWGTVRRRGKAALRRRA